MVRIYPHSYPRIIRNYLQEAGGALVKLGQILALRHEILPPEYCWELSELFDNVTPMSYYAVRCIIVEEYGRQPNEIFTLFEERPIASASFAQVHKAILADGRVVAVKVQRPDLETKVRGDFRFLKFISIIISPVLNLHAIRFSEALSEIEESTYKELDYRLEKDNAEAIRQSITDHTKFYIPKTYSELTTTKVLVQDFVEGIKLNDILRAKRELVGSDKFKDNDLDLNTIAVDIVSELARQYFMGGIYHSDPHPGNIIITSDKRIAFVDFGIVGSVSKYSRAMFWDFIGHIAVNPDPQKAAEAFLKLGLRPIEDRVRYLAQDNQQVIRQFSDVLETLSESFEQPLGSIMKSWSNAIGNPGETLYNRSTAVAFLKALKLAEQYNVHFQKDIIIFIRALVIADMMAMQISPFFKISESLSQFARNYDLVVKDLDDVVLNQPLIENAKLLDPWDEEARLNAREFVFNWFQNMTEDRPSLYKKIKFKSETLKKLLLNKL